MYETLFDIRQNLLKWDEVLTIGPMLVVAVVLVITGRKYPEGFRPRWLPTAVLVFALIAAVARILFPYIESARYARLLDAGAASVVEGRIEHFHSRPDCKYEHFLVADHYFSYSKFEARGRFDQPAPCGGPLHAGMLVRIFYIGDDIVRIERRIQGSAKTKGPSRS